MVLERGCHYSRAPCGRSTTLIYCAVNAVALHSLTLVTLLRNDDDVVSDSSDVVDDVSDVIGDGDDVATLMMSSVMVMMLQR